MKLNISLKSTFFVCAICLCLTSFATPEQPSSESKKPLSELKNLSATDLKSIIDNQLNARGTGDGGGGAGILEIPTNEWEKLVRESMPDYSQKNILDERGLRRLHRQIIIFAYIHSGYRWSDGINFRGMNDSQMRESFYRSRLRLALDKPSSSWTSSEYVFFGAHRLTLERSNYTKPFLTILLRLLLGSDDLGLVQAKVDTVYGWAGQFAGCTNISCLQLVLEERLNVK